MAILLLYGLWKTRMVLCVKCTVAVFFFPRRTVFDTHDIRNTIQVQVFTTASGNEVHQK